MASSTAAPLAITVAEETSPASISVKIALLTVLDSPRSSALMMSSRSPFAFTYALPCQRFDRPLRRPTIPSLRRTCADADTALRIGRLICRDDPFNRQRPRCQPVGALGDRHRALGLLT